MSQEYVIWLFIYIYSIIVEMNRHFEMYKYNRIFVEDTLYGTG